ncbi:hypothetical protein HPB50_028499 [Hyalomma asiaticum]|nr:hypothetical protein HPB50_028499 [Hyalomma asiaticum]
MFNLIYLFMRYHGLLPPDALFIKQEIETVIPDVKNLDKYLPRRDGTVFLTSLAGISVVFDFILYAGVERQQPGMILSAWMWGVIDCSLDAAIGIASGNFTFMDLYRKMYGNATTQQTTLTTTATDEGPRSNDTEYARARKASVYRKTYGNSSMLRTLTTTSAVKYGHRTMYIAVSQSTVEFSMSDIGARMRCLAERRSKIGQTVAGNYANAMRVSDAIAAATAPPTFFRFISFETRAPHLQQTVPKGDAASVRVVRSPPGKQRRNARVLVASVSTVRD